jgi:hypothetical protein
MYCYDNSRIDDLNFRLNWDFVQNVVLVLKNGRSFFNCYCQSIPTPTIQLRSTVSCLFRTRPASNTIYSFMYRIKGEFWKYIHVHAFCWWQGKVDVDVVEWSRALDVRLSEWCCSVSMVWVQIPSRGEQKFDSSKI